MKVILIKKNYVNKNGETKVSYNYFLVDGLHSVAIKSKFDNDYTKLREYAEEVIDKTKKED